MLPHASAVQEHGPQEAIRLLVEAYKYARECQQDLWDWAVELHYLQRMGISINTLRWLLYQGFLVHRVETTRPEAKRRSFRPVANPGLSERSCFVLTEAGVQFACHTGVQTEKGPGQDRGAALNPTADGDGGRKRPCWDRERRELRVGSHVVKRFTQPALSQETILAALEEEGWPFSIDDPLPPRPETNPKARLHSAVNNLNRSQKPPRVQFRTCRNGEGICWDINGLGSGRNQTEYRGGPERDLQDEELGLQSQL
jgi:hypothetical protein